MEEPVINSERLRKSVEDMMQIMRTARGGFRPDGGRRARDLFTAWCRDAGCRVTVDGMGNIFARREGVQNHLPPVVTGGRLDTAPAEGRFDFGYGILAGLEVVRALNDAGKTTRSPLEIAVWADDNSEGPPVFPDHPVAAFLGASVEEAPVLEREAKDIGVVTAVVGVRWYDVKVTGEAAHPGTKPMQMRRDALAGAARIISEVNLIGHAYLPNAYATAGELHVYPNSRTVIPGHATFAVDLRHSEPAVLEAMEQDMLDAANKLSRSMRLRTTVKRVMDQPPLLFAGQCVDIMRDEVRGLGLTHRDMVSGTRQDVRHFVRLAPAAMILVPFKGGMVHHDKESGIPGGAAAGCRVLLRSMVRIADLS